MSVEQHTLSNGARIIIDRIPTVQTASIQYTFDRGARHETKKENGIAHNLEHLAFKGTTSRSARQLLQDIDFLGVKANAMTGQDTTGYYLIGAADQVNDMNRILHDIAANMNYPEEHINIERGVIIGEIGEAMDDPGDVVHDAYMRTAFPNHAFGRTILGPKLHIENFSKADFDKFREKHYHANNLVVSVAGNVDPAAILKEMEATAGQMASGKSKKLKKPEYVGGFEYVTKPTNENVQIRLGFNAAAEGNNANLAAAVMNTILGGSFSSRLFEEVREKRGLGYIVGSGAYRTYDAGTQMLVAGVTAGKVPELMSVFSTEINKMKQELVTDKEFESAKNGFKVSMLLGDESVAGRMRGNTSSLLYKGRIGTSEEFLEKLNALTKEDIQKAAQNSFSGVPTLSAVGPGDFPDYDAVVQSLEM